VTKFTLKTYPLGLVWGGAIFISPEHAQDVFAATAKFQSENCDAKAAMILGINSVLMPTFGPSPIPLINLLLFYAAPEPAPGVFDDFKAIPTLDVTGFGQALGTTTYASLVDVGNQGGADSIAPRQVRLWSLTDHQANAGKGRYSTLMASLTIPSTSST
jgi:hypothetical protein